MGRASEISPKIQKPQDSLVEMDIKGLVKKCAQEVLRTLSLREGMDALDKQRAYGDALLRCVRRHFVKKMLPDEVGYGSGCIYAVKYLPVPSYDIWGREIDRDVVILESGVGFLKPQQREELMEEYKQTEISFCIIDKKTQEELEEELNRYIALDCEEHRDTPALMCWYASYMEENSPLEEWNALARRLNKEWEEERKV